MLIDSSAWIEYLRGTGSAVNAAVRRAIGSRDVHVTDTVRLELLCGASSEARARELTRLLDGAEQLEMLVRVDAEAAGNIYRRCLRGGETVRRANDCLIAAVAIRHDVPVLHRDTDFDAIARHTALRIAQP